MHFVSRRLACLIAATAALLFAEDWKTVTTLPMVDMKGLTPARANTALRIMRNYDCSCGCGMKVAQCRIEDPGCSYSKGLAAATVEAVRAGNGEQAVLAAVSATNWAKGPEPPKLLGDPVSIPTAGSPVRGPASARVTLVEFSDFQCPYCYKAVEQIQAVLNAYPNEVKLIFKQFPLDTHSQAALAASAAIAAHKQGKFWELHDAMFANRRDLSRPAILALASKSGLDVKRFAADLDSPEMQKVVAKDLEDGERAGVEGTPTVYINGQKYGGSLELDAIRKVIDAELQKK
jgi:protein-disulfide isomerase